MPFHARKNILQKIVCINIRHINYICFILQMKQFFHSLTHPLPPKFIYPFSEAEFSCNTRTDHTRLSPQSVTGMGGSAMLMRQRVSGSECVKNWHFLKWDWIWNFVYSLLFWSFYMITYILFRSKARIIVQILIYTFCRALTYKDTLDHVKNSFSWF